MADIGRPSKYQPGYAEKTRELCEAGATDAELADFFDVSIRTIANWRNAHPEFLHAMKVGKETPDDRVERSLYQRAVGYTFDAVKIFMPAGAAEPVVVPYREHVPPSETAAFRWLSNRRKDEWREKVVHANDPENPLPDGSGAVDKLAAALDRLSSRQSAG